MLLFIIFTICLILQLTPNFAQDCSISLPKKDDRNEPIILINRKSKYELFIPENGAVTVNGGGFLHLYCPRGRNKLEQSNSNLTAAICVRQETLSIFKQQYEFITLKCSMPPIGTVVVTNSECGYNKGHTINIGYEVRNDWINLIQVCYDSDEGNALYAEHIVFGQAIKFASKQKYRPSFQQDGVAKGFSPNIAYKQVTQKKTFTELLGSEKLADKYIFKSSFLARGHLAPDADFLFAGLQFTTYFYINTCPQWEVINAGNWLGIERMVRKAADSYQKPLRIITGSHGILTLPDVNDNSQKIYLDDKGLLPVPKFLWKIIYDESSKKAIAFVAINNPFIKSLTAEDWLCPDICSTYGWDSSGWSNMKKGFVYCCDIKILQKTVQTIPKLTIKGILKA